MAQNTLPIQEAHSSGFEDVHNNARKPKDDQNPSKLYRLAWDTDLTAFNFGAPIPPSVVRYADPVTLSTLYKAFLSVLGCIANFSTTYSGGSYTSGASAMAEEWNVSRVAILVGVTIYTIGFAITPMALAPLSELYGRRPIFTATGMAFVLFSLCCSLTRLYAGMLVARLLVGVASSTFAVVVVGVVADVYEDDSARTKSLTFFTAGALFGNGFGPLISGYIVQRLGWRWLFYVSTIFLAVMVATFILFWRETRSVVLLSRKARALNQWLDEIDGKDGNGPNKSSSSNISKEEKEISPKRHTRFTTQADEERGSLSEMIALSLARPFRLLFTEPVVFFFSLWAAFSWSIMYALLIVVPYTFQTVYGFDLETSSAVFAAMCVGSVLATVLSLHHDAIAAKWFPRRLLESKSPETRLYFAGVEGALLPIGLFWYGWSAQIGTHWIVPTLALSCATMAMFSIYLAVFSYLSAAYRQYAASANAAQSFARNMLGGAFPLFSEAMFRRLGFGGACSLLGGVGILLTFVPWALIFYGPQIRARSKFAFAD
ncbi:hypothetical protein FH972_023844 [Carpinus fangiana]|uniref:Major facilitator superfamily (MFS) profile domain-containing protein n=1 Tax=Carpinus fangiana TaxID=176857 RepID=A0A5N6KWD4_9ROSI|nr:hypothetical protein FH972_023844 [Carpinus fangiana]